MSGPSLLQRLPSALSYVVHDRLKSAFYIILARRPELSLLLPVFCAWRQHWRRERRQATQTDIFKVFQAKERIRRCFRSWRAYWALHKELHKAQSCMMLLRRYTLVHRMWKLWAIVAHHERTSRALSRAVFPAWVRQMAHQRQKTRLNETLKLQRRHALSRRMSLWMNLARCIAWNRSRMAFCCLQRWHHHAAHRQQLRAKALTFLHSSLRHRRPFGRWVTALKSERMRQEHFVSKMDECFNTWKQGVMVEAKRRLFVFQVRHQLVYIVFNEWVRQRRLMQRLIVTYASRTLQGSARDMLVHWLNYVRQEKIARKVRMRRLARKALRSWIQVFVLLDEQMHFADAWHANRVVYVFLHRMRAASHSRAVGRQKATSALRQIAAKMDVANIAAAVNAWMLFVRSEQHRAACVSYVRDAQVRSATAAHFTLWRTHASMLAHLRHLSIKVITNIHAARKSLCFFAWRRYAESKRRHRTSSLTIRTQAAVRLERAHFGQWRAHALVLARVRRLCTSVKMSAYWNHLKWTFTAWASDARMRKIRQEHKVWATRRHRVTSCTKCFVSWARYVSTMIRAKDTSDAMNREHKLLNAAQQLKVWRENVCRRHKSTRLLTNVFLHRVQRLTAMAVRAWVTSLSIKQMRAHCESTIRERNEARIKRAAVKTWRAHASACIDRHMRVSLMLVEANESRRTMMFTAWHRTGQKLRAQRDTAAYVRHFGRRRRIKTFWTKWALEFDRIRRFNAFSRHICLLHRSVLLAAVLRTWNRRVFCTKATRVMAHKLSRSQLVAYVKEWHHVAKSLHRLQHVSSVICQRRHRKHYFLKLWKARLKYLTDSKRRAANCVHAWMGVCRARRSYLFLQALMRMHRIQYGFRCFRAFVELRTAQKMLLRRTALHAWHSAVQHIQKARMLECVQQWRLFVRKRSIYVHHALHRWLQYTKTRLPLRLIRQRRATNTVRHVVHAWRAWLHPERVGSSRRVQRVWNLWAMRVRCIKAKSCQFQMRDEYRRKTLAFDGWQGVVQTRDTNILAMKMKRRMREARARYLMPAETKKEMRSQALQAWRGVWRAVRSMRLHISMRALDAWSRACLSNPKRRESLERRRHVRKFPLTPRRDSKTSWRQTERKDPDGIGSPSSLNIIRAHPRENFSPIPVAASVSSSCSRRFGSPFLSPHVSTRDLHMNILSGFKQRPGTQTMTLPPPTPALH